MNKFYETQDEQSIEILGNMLNEMADIYEDEEIKEFMKSGGKMYRFASLAFKKYPENVRRFLAIYEGVPYEEYHCNGFAILSKFMGALSDSKVNDFLSEAVPQNTEISGGSATENTEESGN